MSYFGLEDSRGGDDQRALHAALARVAPELAAEWPVYRDLDGTVAGVAQRQDNVSEAWAWLGSCDIARGYAADLFEGAQLAAIPSLVEHTAEALNALLGTMVVGRPARVDGRSSSIAPTSCNGAGKPR